MFAFQYQVRPSLIPGAGQGIFADEPLSAGKVMIFPNDRSTLLNEEAWQALDPTSIEAASTIRWFETTYTMDPGWSDEAFLNHSFEPNAFWHLGFVFALRKIETGEEITIDYRPLLAAGVACDFCDAVTGRAIIGFTFAQAMAVAGETLLQLFAEPAAKSPETQ